MSATLSRPPTAAPLTRVLWLDAATCLGMGAVLIAAAVPLAGLLAMPAPLLRVAGLALLPIAAFIALTAAGRLPGRLPLILIVVGNLGWVGASLALAAGAFVAPNGLGVAFLVAQAAVVLALSLAEARLGGLSSARDAA